MIELFPDGFEEVDGPDGVELAAYTDPAGEERLWHAFGSGSATDVAGGWEDRWRQFHRPVRVGPLWVGPPWESPPPDAVAVVVDPGRAFGTGAHATTRLCLALLLEREPTALLDVGCGSGVLAIAAAKLGYSPVLALDADPAAVEATRENAARNAAAVDVRCADALSDPLPDAAVAVANVTLEVVAAVAPRLRANVLLASGYLVSERPELPRFRHVERREEAGWAADVFARESG